MNTRAAMASAANIQGEEAMPNIHTPKAVDVIVVGAGATGGTAAKVLSERGLEVVLFDRGPWLKPKDYSGDEIKYINRNFLWPDPEAKAAHRPRQTRMRKPNCFRSRPCRSWSAAERRIGLVGCRVHCLPTSC